MAHSAFILHAPNIHCGGGLTLLKALVEVLPDRSFVIIDERFPVSDDTLKRFHVKQVKPTVRHRLGAEYFLHRLVKPDDNVLCFGNLPPLFPLKGKVKVFLQNRYLIDKVNLTGFSLKGQLRLIIERLWFRLFRNRVGQVIVQSSTMKNLLEANFMMSAKIIPFIACANQFYEQKDIGKSGEKKYDFIYVASGEPHKNHSNLIKAWTNLAADGLRPSLCLTLNEDHFPELLSWIEREKNEYRLNLHNLGAIPGENIQKLYTKSQALIFPSTLESFGLPLIEAKKLGLAIIASELDYVRDLFDPEESFDPNSPVSIARAVHRFMGYKEKKNPLLDAEKFLQKLLLE